MTQKNRWKRIQAFYQAILDRMDNNKDRNRIALVCLQQVIGQFSLKTGLTPKRIWDYMDVLISAGLIWNENRWAIEEPQELEDFKKELESQGVNPYDPFNYFRVSHKEFPDFERI